MCSCIFIIIMDYLEFAKVWNDGHRFVEMKTSGSTGTPKTIRMSKADMARSARATNAHFGITSSSVLGIPLSMDYVAGKMMAVRAWEAGCRLVVIEPSNRFVLPERVDLLSIVPSQIENVLNSYTPADIGALLIGGAAPRADMIARLRDRGFKGAVTYGMTETASHVALADIAAEDAPFEALPGIVFSTDSRGCLVIDAPDFDYRSVTTNDIVTLIDNRRFRMHGRIDNAINSGGIKIHPEMLERAIPSDFAYPFYFTGEADEKWGERLVLVIECRADEAAETGREINRLIPGHMLKRIYAVDRIPTTSTGKPRRLPPSQLNVIYSIVL